MYAAAKVCVCVYDTFPKPVVIGESLQRILASSLEAACTGNGGRRLVSRDRSWSKACQRLLVIVGAVRGAKLSGGRKKTSVNVSLARDSCAAGNKGGAVRRE